MKSNEKNALSEKYKLESKALSKILFERDPISLDKAIKILLPLGVAILIFAIVINFSRESKLSKITYGMTQEEVIKVAGAPSRIYNKNTWGYYSETLSSADGVTGNPVNENYFRLIVRFNKENKVDYKKSHANIAAE